MENQKKRKIREMLYEDTPAGRLRRMAIVRELLCRYFDGTATRDEKQSVEYWQPGVPRSGDVLPERDGAACNGSGCRMGQQDSTGLSGRSEPPVTDDNRVLVQSEAGQVEMERRIYREVARRLQFAHTEFREYQPHVPAVAQRSVRVRMVSWVVVAVVVLCMGNMILLLSRQPVKPAKQQTGMSMADSRQEWQTSGSQMLRIVLPDGSRVAMNADSKLEILKPLFNRETREVWLSGEAFFEVTKNTGSPFIIHTGTIETVVHGTSFNVKAYPSFGEHVVTVRDGMVEVREEERTLGVLTADCQLTYRTDCGRLSTGRLSWWNAAGWVDGAMVFNAAGEEEVRLRLCQRFRVEVEIEPGAFRGRRLSGTFRKNENLEYVLRNMTLLLGVRCTVNDRKVTIRRQHNGPASRETDAV